MYLLPLPLKLQQQQLLLLLYFTAEMACRETTNRHDRTKKKGERAEAAHETSESSLLYVGIKTAQRAINALPCRGGGLFSELLT